MNKVKSSEEPWTRDEIDYLLDHLFLNDFQGHQWNRACLIVGPIFGRSIDSIQTLIRKLAIRYPDHSDYKPFSRNKRTGPFNWLDKYILRTAANWLGNNPKCDPPPDDVYLAGILGRKPEEIVAYREMQRAKGRKSLGVFK